MEKQTQYHHQQQLLIEQQQQQQALKCPRCDSHNTKFCYYNNYSLSQPRHFCKSCKRYWTRGGTLRNVPVGGGCRKNKKVVKKFSISAVDLPSSSSLPTTIPTNITNPNLNPPLFYGVPVDSSSYKVVNIDKVSDDTDHRTQMNMDHGLGFANSESILSSYPSLFWSSTTSLDEQQKYILDGKFIGQASHVHDAKMDKSQNKIDWFNNIVPGSFENQIQQVGSSSDSSLLWMLDHANNGSSAP
jgi:hypothetical protein